MDKFISDFTAIFQNDQMFWTFLNGTWETLYSTFIATAVAYILGLALGVALTVGEENGIHPLPRPLMKVLNVVINILRSMPFLLLMILCLPLSGLLVGTEIGTVASIPPLIIAAAPFVARLVETSFREVDRGVLEAAQSMGCSTLQIIWKVILPESRPSLIAGFATAFITILGYGAMAGFIGGGGLGMIATTYGYNRYNDAVMLVAVVIIVILVQIFQSLGTRLSIRSDKRITRVSRQKKNKRK